MNGLGLQLEAVRGRLPELFLSGPTLWEKVYGTAPVHTEDPRIPNMLYMIEHGYARQAGELAKELATEAYEDELNRHFCEETGNVYFLNYREL